MIDELMNWDYVVTCVERYVPEPLAAVMARRLADFCLQFKLPNPDAVYGSNNQITAVVRYGPDCPYPRTAFVFSSKGMTIVRTTLGLGGQPKRHIVDSAVFAVFAAYIRMYLGHPEHL